MAASIVTKQTIDVRDTKEGVGYVRGLLVEDVLPVRTARAEREARAALAL